MAVAPLAVSGALLGAAVAVGARRRLPPHWRSAAVAATGAGAALVFGRGVEALVGAPFGALAPTVPLLLGAVLAACVAALVLGRAGVLDDDRATAPTVAALVLAALALVPLPGVLVPNQQTSVFRHLAIYWMFVGGALVLAILALARWRPHWLERAWSAAAGRAMRVPRVPFVGGAALFAFAAAVTIAIVCFSRLPNDVDETSQLWHAKMLASGRLALPVDPNAEFFAMDDMVVHGAWYSQFPIGGPAFLALGAVLHAAWLVNPLLLALSVVGIYAFARRAFGEGTARVSAVLLALAPFALFMAAGYLNHMAVLFLATVALAQLAVWLQADRPRKLLRSAALIGLVLGVAFTVRPLDALVLAAGIGVMQLVSLTRDRRRLPSLGLQIAAGLVPVALLLYVNARTTGSPIRFGYDMLYGDANRLGFHADPYGVVHTPARAFAYVSKYLFQLNVLLFEWPLPALGVIIAGLLALRRPSRWDYLLLALIAAQCVAYSFYWAEGMFRGPRYIFTIVPAAIILVARAPFLIASASRGALRVAAPWIVTACVLLTWLAVGSSASIAGRMRQYRRTAVSRVSPDSLARAAGLRHALVFINEDSKSRAMHQLWSLGLGRGETLRLLASAPLCGVRLAIEAEEALVPQHETGRLNRLIHTATSFDPTSPLPPACQDDVRRDREGWTSYLPFFSANEVDANGRVGGEVIYALDLGARNELLRARFGDRTWYRFRQHRLEGAVTGEITRY